MKANERENKESSFPQHPGPWKAISIVCDKEGLLKEEEGKVFTMKDGSVMIDMVVDSNGALVIGYDTDGVSFSSSAVLEAVLSLGNVAR